MLKRLAARLPITLATFLFSLFATAALTRMPKTPDAPAPDCAPRLVAPAPVSSPANYQAEPAHVPDKTPRISQQKIVNFPGIGQVRITANEACELCPELEFRDAKTNRLLSSSHFSGDASGEDNNDAQVRFRVMHITGLPDPMIVGIGISPDGSDDSWSSVAVGAVNGALRELTSETLNASNQGGFYYGDLGGGRGIGTIGCDAVFGNDSDEGHYSAHHYELKIYTWDKKTNRFEWHQVLRTRGKFDSGEKALRSMSFKFADIRKTFPDFADWLE